MSRARNILSVLGLALFVMAAQPHLTSIASMMAMSEMSSEMDCPSEGMSTMQECCAHAVSNVFVIAGSKKVEASVQLVGAETTHEFSPGLARAASRTESPPGANSPFSRINAPLLL